MYLSRLYPQIVSNSLGWKSFNFCLAPFLSIVAMLSFFHSEEKAQASVYWLKIFSRGF